MFPAQHLSVKGNFVFEVFDKDNHLKKKVGPIDNFITSTGLGYPASFAFADCFRYISLGTGNKVNALGDANNIWGTTGLDQPHPDYQYIGGRRSYSETVPGESSNYFLSECTSVEGANGVTLSRSWRIPTGTDNFQDDITFTEYMVSPGQPPVYGYTDPSDAGTKQCLCAASDIDGTKYPFLYNLGETYGVDQPTVSGPEHSILGDYYGTGLCNANKAFARVLNTIEATKGDSIHITYNLVINFNTNPKIFSVVGDSQEANWGGTISGYCGLIHHGLKLINGTDANIAQGIVAGPGLIQNVTQDYSYTVPEYGESYIPPWGDPMEPSRTGQLVNGAPFPSIIAYVSTDNLQFAFDATNGGNLPVGSPQSSGVMGWVSHPSTTFDSDPNAPKLFNIRQFASYSNYADMGNFHSDTDVTADSIGLSVVCLKNTLYTYNSFETPATLEACNERGRYRDFSVEFHGTDVASDGASPMNGQIKALTLAYQDPSSATNGTYFANAGSPETTVPFFDAVFASSGEGGAILPAVVGNTYNTGNQKGYFYLAQDSNLKVGFRRSWSSDCPSSVKGCPGYVE